MNAPTIMSNSEYSYAVVIMQAHETNPNHTKQKQLHFTYSTANVKPDKQDGSTCDLPILNASGACPREKFLLLPFL